MSWTLEGRILAETGLVPGRIEIENDTIAGIEPADVPADAPTVLPGFIDLHCHGGAGVDVMQAGDAANRIARAHAGWGTTSFLATTMTAEMDDILAAVDAVSAAARSQGPDEAAILGVHLEGPFISRDRLGAQPDRVLPGDARIARRLMERADIRVVTCAPEADPDGAMTRYLSERGVRVQIGHSSCDYETAQKAFADGRHGVTHMFNAMSSLHHRAPGIVGAALAHAGYAELIPDLLHVHPGAIRAALRAIPGVYAVTDASPAAGMPDGDYRLGTQHVRKCGNGVRLADGTLAGSSLTMFQAFSNLVSIGLSIEEAARRTATLAADYLGLEDRGRIAPGLRADLVVLGPQLELEAVVLRGRKRDPGAPAAP